MSRFRSLCDGRTTEPFPGSNSFTPNPEDRARRDSRVDRVEAFASGIAYGGLCVLAIEILTGAGGGNSASPKKATAGVFGWPGGVWIVGIAGAVMIGVALYQGYRGIKRNSSMIRKRRRWRRGSGNGSAGSERSVI